MPSVVRSGWLLAFVAANRSLFVLKYHAHFIAARPNDLLAALNVRLLLTIALFGSVANGVYFWPFVTQSQWISSASTITPCLRQISPMRVSSAGVHALPVGFCGLQRMNVLVAGLMRFSKSSKSNVKRPLTTFITLSSGSVPVLRRSP